jgi:hypothetical protein
LFTSDVRRALRVWRFDPRLPIAALLIVMAEGLGTALTASTGDSGYGIVGGIVTIALLGFLGTERVWYLAGAAGERLEWEEIRELTGRFWKRYFGLGVYVSLFAGVPIIVIAVALERDSVPAILLNIVVVLAIDVSLTFATATLPFGEYNAPQAIVHSWSIVRTQWPACAFYVLVPPLAFELMFRLLPNESLPLPAIFASQLAVGAIALLCKGATMLFYADRYLSAEPDVVDDSR